MTDPVDTDALRSQQWQNVDELVEWATAAAVEVDRLRAGIENAPHGHGCRHVDWVDGALQLGKCTCWKADAL